MGVAPYKEAVLATSGLISLWDLGESSGAYTDVKDGNPGEGHETITRAQTSLLPNGEGKCATLDGTAGYVSVPTAANLELGDAVSLEAWIKLGALGSERAIIDLGINSLRMVVRSDNKLWMGQQGVVLIASSTSTLNEAAHHCVVTKEGGSQHVYVDAVDVTSFFSAATLSAATSTKTIGRSAPSAAAFFKGSLQYVAVYNKAISAATVAEHKAAAEQAPSSGQKVYFPLSRRNPVVNP